MYRAASKELLRYVISRITKVDVQFLQTRKANRGRDIKFRIGINTQFQNSERLASEKIQRQIQLINANIKLKNITPNSFADPPRAGDLTVKIVRLNTELSNKSRVA